MNWLISQLIGLGLRRNDRRLWGSLDRQAHDPASAQRETLLGILALHRETTFGRAHGFGDIGDASAFARAVPVNTYDSLADAIARQETEATAELTSEMPLLYAQTSGTTGTPKYLPITPNGLGRQARAQRLLASMVGRTTNIFSGSILGVGSPAVEGYRPSGKPYGSASGLIFDGMPRLIRSRYVLDDATIALEDHEERYFEIARLSLLATDLTAMATANPSTFVRLIGVIEQRWDELVRRVEATDDRRARDLRRLGDPTQLGLGDLWPRLEVLTTWTGGSCGLALEQLAPRLPTDIDIFELGYSASELRGSVTLGPGRVDGVPLLGDVFYEFAPRAAWEAGDRTLYGAHELDLGKQYYIVVTTVDGLYRYDMNDIVETVAMHHRTPTFAFVQKGKGVTNITGEKLSEHQVITAMRRAGGGRLPGAGFFLALADAERARYRVWVEGPLETSPAAMAQRVDSELSTLNLEYAGKRKSGRLQPVELAEVRPGTAHAYRLHCVRNGQRDAQFKVLYLQPAEACTFDFAEAEVR